MTDTGSGAIAYVYAMTAAAAGSVRTIHDAASIVGVADGANVTAWRDAVGGVTTTGAAGLPYDGGTPTYVASAVNGHPGIAFMGGAFAVPNITGVSGALILSTCRTDLTPTNGADMFFGSQTFGPQPLPVSNDADTTLWIETRTGFNAGVTCYEDGKPVGLALNRRTIPAVAGVVLSSPATVSILGGNGYRSAWATAAGIITFGSVPTSAVVAELTTLLHSFWATTPQPTPKVARLFLGDSETSEDNSSTVANLNSTYPGLVARAEAARLGLSMNQLTWANLGYYGDVVTGCLSIAQGRGAATVQALVAAGYTSVAASVLIGTNNLYASTPADPVATAAVTAQIGDALRAAGATQLNVVTVFARGTTSGNQATCDANRATYNALELAMVPAHFDAVTRMDRDVYMGPNGSQTNATYFVSDQTHMTAAGIGRLANAVEAQGFNPPLGVDPANVSAGVVVTSPLTGAQATGTRAVGASVSDIVAALNTSGGLITTADRALFTATNVSSATAAAGVGTLNTSIGAVGNTSSGIHAEILKVPRAGYTNTWNSAGGSSVVSIQ